MTTVRPTRLLVVGLDWPPEPFIEQLLRALRETGLDLTVASAHRPPAGAVDSWVAVPAGVGVPWRATGRLAMRSPRGLARAAFGRGSPGGHPGRRQALRLEALARSRPDVIYVPWTATAVHEPHIFELGAPVIVSCRGAQVNVAPWNPARPEIVAGLPMVFERAAAVHCVSAAIEDEARHHGLDRERSTVIRPAVDRSRFPPRPPHDRGGPLRLLSIGSVTWRKGIEYALIAVRRLLDEGLDLHFEIVGPEADGGATRHAIHDLDLTDRVHLVGSVEPAEVPDHVGDADILVLPSLSEGIANVVLEAMATGRPVVVTDCGGMREVVDDGVEGRVVPVRDAGALADAIRDLADPHTRSRMGRAGRARVAAHHDLAEQATAFASLIERARRGP